MNKIEIAVDTTLGTKKDITLTCGDQVVTCDVPDEVFYGVDGRTPDPRYILRDVVTYLGPALAQLQVTSAYSPPTLPAAPETKDQVSDEDEPKADFRVGLDWAGGVTGKHDE